MNVETNSPSSTKRPPSPRRARPSARCSDRPALWPPRLSVLSLSTREGGFRELRARVDAAGLDDETLVERLEGNEALAHMVAEVVRGTIESDLAAKRALLARAAIRGLKDDAVVDVEARVVRTAVEMDTADIRVLAIVGGPKTAEGALPERREGTVSVDEIIRRWPGGAEIVGASIASLTAAGLIEDPGVGALRHSPQARITRYGREFLNRLLEEGLEDELTS